MENKENKQINKTSGKRWIGRCCAAILVVCVFVVGWFVLSGNRNYDNIDDSENAENSENIVNSVYADDSENSDDFVVARVNGMDIYASDVRIHLLHAEEMLQWEHFMMFEEWEIVPDREYTDGVTFERAIQEEAVRLAAFSVLYEDIARERGITLTNDEQSMIDEEIDRLVEHFGAQELNDMLREDGFRNQQHLAELYVSQFTLLNLIEEIVEDSEEFSRFEQYMTEEEVTPELLGAKHILANFDNFDSEEYAEVFANDILTRLSDGEDFDTLMSEYSQDPGLWDFPNGYTFASGDMVSEFEQTTRELEIGEISEIVKSTFGFHIIMRTEPIEDDWYLMRNIQPKTQEDRMMEAVFQGLESMAEQADIEFLPSLANVSLTQ